MHRNSIIRRHLEPQRIGKYLTLLRNRFSTANLPTTARTVIIGGGAIGSSVAYHLAKMGRKEIILLEQGSISCGTTWHAAGLVGQMRNTPSEIYLSCYGTELYSELESETGQSTGFKRCGSLTLAQNTDRMIALKRNAARARAFGIEAEIISPQEANDKLDGLIETKDLKGALWLPGDGTVSPSDLTASYIAGAKQQGVSIVENIKVLGFDINPTQRKVDAVKTDQGDIKCDEVINCAGQWARNVGLMAGVSVPLHSAEHFYVITEPFGDSASSGEKGSISKTLPLFRDPDSYTYFREWSGGLCVGGFEPQSKPCFPAAKNQRNAIPGKFEFQLFNEDWEHFNILMEGALNRIPSLSNAGIRQMVNGPESFTADNQYILGEAPELRKFFVAAGFNSSGIASSGGVGKALAEWVVAEEPTLDLWTVDIRRFSSLQNNGKYLHDRTLETLGLHYQINYPKRELESSRPLRKSALFDRLEKKGAVFGNKFGWERPNYFKGIEAAGDNIPAKSTFTFGKPHWFDSVRQEHLACRENVAMFDISSFSKLLITGRDATSFLERICSNKIDVDIGKIVYTGLLNSKGGMESDCTITRISHDEYLLITSTGQATRDMDWLKRNMIRNNGDSDLKDEHVSVVDMTSAYSVLSVMGPRSRELLSRVTTFNLENNDFPFGTSKLIDMGYATIRANRITYVGELGWELYIPTEMATYVYDLIKEAASPSDKDLIASQRTSETATSIPVVDAGYYAIDSLRMEKGYKAWGHDLSSDWSPFECGVGFAVKTKKKVSFIGQESAKQHRQEIKEKLPEKLLLTFSIDDGEVFPWGGEPILFQGDTVGFVTSAAYGFSIGKGVVMAMVKGCEPMSHVKDLSLKRDSADSGSGFQIEVNGERYALTVAPGGGTSPLYDPSSSRIKM